MKSRIRLIFIAICTVFFVWVNIFFINMPAMVCIYMVILEAFLLPMVAAQSLIPILDMKVKSKDTATVLSGMLGGIIPITTLVISTYIAVSNSPQHLNNLQYSKQLPLSTAIVIDWMIYGRVWLFMMGLSILGGMAARSWLRRQSDHS